MLLVSSKLPEGFVIRLESIEAPNIVTACMYVNAVSKIAKEQERGQNIKNIHFFVLPRRHYPFIPQAEKNRLG